MTQCIFYDLEVLVLRIDASLRVQTVVGRPHICGHIRNVQLIYLWKCIGSGPGCEIIVQWSRRLAGTDLCSHVRNVQLIYLWKCIGNAV